MSYPKQEFNRIVRELESVVQAYSLAIEVLHRANKTTDRLETQRAAVESAIAVFLEFDKAFDVKLAPKEEPTLAKNPDSPWAQVR